jgi:hypothetical protein
MFYCNTGLQTTGWVEGLYMTGFEIAFCGNFGMPAVDLNSSAPNLGSAFHLVNGSVTDLQHGMRLTNLRDVRISKVWVIHSSGNPFASSGTDLALNNCTDAVISDDTFLGVDNEPNQHYPDETCILLSNSHSVQIIGNYFTHVLPANTGICIDVQSTSNRVRIVNNVFGGGSPEYGGVKQAYNDAGSDTYYWGNSL